MSFPQSPELSSWPRSPPTVQSHTMSFKCPRLFSPGPMSQSPPPMTSLGASTAPMQPSLHKALLEVASESLALVALDLAVLDSPALQVVIHLCCVDGSCPLLILG